MTFPRASKPLLIWMPSCRRAPSAFVRFARSEPARSTRCIFARVTSPGASAPADTVSTWMVNMACERDDRSFMPVAAVARAFDPSRSALAISSIVRTSFSRAPTSATPPPSGASRRVTALFGRNRSRISSLWISMNPTLIATEVSPGSAATRSNSVRMTRGITPRGSRSVSDAKSRDASRAVPIVKVLPEPVWPYASTVAL